MEVVVDKFFFSVIAPPNVRISAPKWLQFPSPMQTLALIMGVYFLVTGGVVYDIINEPPSIGSEIDERGNSRPVSILKYRINGQYIMEGLAASFMFTLGGIGFIVLDKCNQPQISRNNRIMLLCVGFLALLISFFVTRMFMKMKLPDYMS